MKKLIVVMVVLMGLMTACGSLPRVQEGYVKVRNNDSIYPIKGRIYIDDTTIYIKNKDVSTYTIEKRDIKELYIIFDDGDVRNHVYKK
jgi:hypothetical protein